MQAYDLGIHEFSEVLGIDVNKISFYWKLRSDRLEARQTAYRVLVSTNPDVRARNDGAIAWDSGKVSSDAQRNVICCPKEGFRSTCFYFWKVWTYDEQDNATCSPISSFFTAYPNSRRLPPWSMDQTYMPHTSLIFRTWFEDEVNRWKAEWIGSGRDKPFYARKSLSLPNKPHKAIAFASGLGHFNLTVNGAPTSINVLDPGWTNYHRSVQFVAYDLTEHLNSGENAIGAHVGNGFYAGDQGVRFFWPTYEDNTYVRWGNELCFFYELHIFSESGDHQVFHSGPDWQVRDSATLLANLNASETHDRILHPEGWDTPSFDATTWIAAKPLTGPRGELRYQSQPAITVQEIFEPVRTVTVEPGTVVYDLGQNSSIMVKIALRGSRGDKVIVRYSETLGDDGRVFMPDPLFKDFETKVYSEIYLSGSPDIETWQPDFCFTSARYVQLGDVPDLPVVHSLVGQHVSSSAERLGNMKTDKEVVNKLWNACYWSFKFGWLEATHLLAHSTQYIRNTETLHSKILDDILEAQEPSGFVPNMAPDIRFMCGPMRDSIAWGCAICFIPKILKTYYGSTHVIPRVYPAAVRYMEYMKTKERRGGLIEHGLGDWGRDIAFGNSQANIETAIYHECLKCCEMMAQELNLQSDAERFVDWAERIYEVYNATLLVKDDPQIASTYYTSLDNYPKRDCTAVNQAMALRFGMVPTEHVAAVEEAFLADVSDGKLKAGEISLRYLFDTLGLLQRPDIVLQMARQEDHPSYMRFIRKGETTLNEFRQDECRSKCHDMLGTIFEWLYAHVLGVKPTTDAYKTFSICPPYDSEFQDVEGTVHCPYGEIAVHYKATQTGKFGLKVTIPMGSTATIRMPVDHRGGDVRNQDDQITKVDSSTRSIDFTHGEFELNIG